MDDTSSDAWRLVIDGYRRMPPERKIATIQRLNRLTTSLAMSDIRARHPNASERELRLRLASRRIGPELLRRHFDWDVRARGY